MNRQAQAVVMLLLGGTIVKISLTDVYLRYVKAGLQPFLLAAGALLVLAALMTLWYELRKPATAAHDGHDGHDHGVGGGHHEPRIGWLILAPTVALLLVAPPAMGSFSATQSGTALAANATSDFAPLPAGDPAEITVLDYASRAVFDKGASLGDRKVQITGFLTGTADGSQMLARMILSCCAADARPIKVAFAGQGPTGLPDDSWVEIVGTYSDRTTTDAVNGETIPYITVVTWRPVDVPKQQYE